MVAAVLSGMEELPFSERETVVCETPAFLAISLMVTDIVVSLCTRVRSYSSKSQKKSQANYERHLAFFIKMLYYVPASNLSNLSKNVGLLSQSEIL